MGWGNKFPDMKNDPSYLEGRLSNAETSLAEIANSVTKLGVKNDGNILDAHNNSTILNNVFAYLNELFIPDGTYYIDSPITVPPGKKLTMTKNAIIKPSIDTDIFIIGNESTIKEGYVDVREISGYSKSVLSFSDQMILNVNVDGLYAINTVSKTILPSGKFLNLDANGTNKYIIFSSFKFYCEGFQYGINIVNNVSGDGSHGFANGNKFIGTCSSCTYAIYNNGAENNYFDIDGQGAFLDTNQPNIYLKGRHNTIVYKIFDVGNPGMNNVALEIDGSMNTIIGEIPRNLIINHSGAKNTFTNFQVVQPSKYLQSLAGDQSNYLISADKKFTVTPIYTNTVDWADYKYLFRVNGAAATFHFNNHLSLTDNVQILVDFGTTKNIASMGLSMQTNAYCKQIVLEVYSTYDSAWHSKTLYPTSEGFFWWSIISELSFNIVNTISKLRFTLYQPYPSDGTVYIGGLYATSQDGGNAFLPTHGGTVYGDIDLNKNKMKNMVLDSGATGSRPSSPMVGQVFYDTTLGKPIYCKVGGGSPTWTDSVGTTV